MAKVSLCMIVRDEEENLDVCLRSIRQHVDEIIIVDTGSKDGTTRVAVSHGASVFQFDQKTNPEAFFVDDEATCRQFGAPPPYSGMVALGDFAAARNESFRHASHEYILWLDADDSVQSPEALRLVVEDMAKNNLTTGFLPYDYLRDDQGRVFYRQWRERVLLAGSGAWVQPVHEVFMPMGGPPRQGRYEFPLIVHRRKPGRVTIPNRNYKNLLRQYQQHKLAGQAVDPRTLFYLGQESKFVDPKRSKEEFYEPYLKQSGWPEERAAAHCAIGEMMEWGRLGLPADEGYAIANREYATAVAELPGNPDGLYGMARIAYLRGRFQDCVNFTERAMALGNPESMLGANPMDRAYRPHVFYNHALANIGRLEDAIASCKAGLAVCPDDPGVPGGAPGMLKHNLTVFERELEKRKGAVGLPPGKSTVILDRDEPLDTPSKAKPDVMVIWSVQLWKTLMAEGDQGKVHKFLESLPDSVLTDPLVPRMWAATEQNKKRDVVFYLGPGVEHWDPTSPSRTGLGGSETAAIEMAKHLQALGRQVTVYAEAEGKFDGVEYIHHSKFRGADCAVFIASRTPWAINQLGRVRAKLSLLWVHDIHCGPPSPQVEAAFWHFDYILCLSDWHRQYFCSHYPTLDPSRVLVTSNGIDPTRFHLDRKNVLKAKTNRMVWSSSPNRGLLRLLGFVREIRKTVPDAAVDIYYGFETWETMMVKFQNQAELDKIAMYKAEIAKAEAEGVAKFHGRRPQGELAEAFLRAKLWAYPTDFPETSCISAMEAQAAGAIPVCSAFAALRETVKHGVLIEPDRLGTDFVQACIRVLTDDDYRSELASAARCTGLNLFPWKLVAARWFELFTELEKAKQVEPIHKWREAA